MDNTAKETINKNVFGSRLKELLVQNNFSLENAAKIVHLSPSTIGRYVNGTMSPKITTIEKFAEFFRVSPSWLMGIDCPKMPLGDKKTEADLLSVFNDLNSDGKKEALNQLKLLSQIPSYSKNRT